jgi:hypothetical protein
MTKLMKTALLATALMNFFGAVLFVPFLPFFREFYGLPNAVHPLYLWIISSWIFFFGLCYLWLGLTSRRESLFLVIAAAGKISFAILMIAYWISGDIPAKAAAGSLSDLFFGLFFLFYLWQTRNDEIGVMTK